MRKSSEEQQLSKFAGESTVIDAWGVPIYATHPGEVVSAAAGDSLDDDGTERTPNETMYGIARHRRICYVSAGPDRLFGLPKEFPGVPPQQMYEKIREAQKDNIYSYLPIPTGYH